MNNKIIRRIKPLENWQIEEFKMIEQAITPPTENV